MRIVLLLLFAFVAYYGWKWFVREYSQHGRPFLVKTLLIAVAALLLVLAVAGRVHWVGAALAGLLALIRMALPIAIKSLPFLMKWRQTQAGNAESSDVSDTPEALDEATALATLGLQKPTTREAIIIAHKRIMQNIHPDKGGSDLLASQVNAAKALLLKLYPE